MDTICNREPKENEAVVVKHFQSSFRDTELNDLLQRSEVKELIICGAMTHMCIDTTVRAAFDLGYTCNVIYDACATRDLEFKGRIVKTSEVQTAFMASLKAAFAMALTTKEFFEIERGKGGSKGVSPLFPPVEPDLGNSSVGIENQTGVGH